MHDAPDYVPNRCRSAVMGDTRPRDIRHKSGLGMARYLNRSDSHFDLCFTPSLPPFPMRSIRLARPAFVNPLKDLLCLYDGVRDGALPRWTMRAKRRAIFISLMWQLLANKNS